DSQQARDIAQIAYLVVASGDFDLVGVVNDEKAGQPFFGHEVSHPSELSVSPKFSVLIRLLRCLPWLLASHTHGHEMKKNLRRLHFPPSQVFALFN
ncbi:hypothetical protein MYX65_11240, partial [Acidobacteria bacterium AH-259-L09]|nr:hypothetical protein [Acidobacteria bacterium AH-259-L09]